MKNKNRKKIFISIISTNYFKILYIIGIVLALYGAIVLTANKSDFYLGVLSTFTYMYFNVFLFSLSAATTIYTCYQLRKFDSYLIRFKSKEKSLKEIIIITLMINLYLFSMVLFIYFIIVFFKTLGYNSKLKILGYSIKLKEYSIFYIIRYFLYLIVLIIANSILSIKVNRNKLLTINLVFIFGFLFFGYFDEIPTKVFNILPWEYFQLVKYTSFNLEFTYSVYFLILLILMTLLIYLYNFKKTYLKFKYVLIHDISYLYHKRLKLLVIYLLIPVLVFLIVVSNYNLDIISKINNCVGNFLTRDGNVLEKIVTITLTSISVFIGVDILVKDLRYQLDNLFLRFNIEKWIFNKEISIFIITFFLNFFKYLFLILVILLSKQELVLNLNLFKIFVVDFINVLFLELLLIFSYINIRTNKKLIIVSLGLLYAYLKLYPENIYILINYLPCLILAIIIIILINNWAIYKNKKMIIQKLGEK